MKNANQFLSAYRSITGKPAEILENGAVWHLMSEQDQQAWIAATSHIVEQANQVH